MATGYVDANWAEHHHDRWSPDSGNPVVSENQQTDAERL